MEDNMDFLVEKALREKIILSIWFHSHKFYLGKNMRDQFQHAIKIELDEEYPTELRIVENDEQKKRYLFSSAKVILELSENVKVKENMHFYVFRDKKRKIWKGILLPTLNKSYLWERKEHSANILNREERNCIIRALSRNSGKYMKQEDIGQYCDIACCLVQRVAVLEKEELISCIAVYAESLLKEWRRAERRQRTNVIFSMDHTINCMGRDTLWDRFGSIDMHYSDIEIKDFKSRLTERERQTLNLRLNEFPFGSLGSFKRMTLEKALFDLKQKAEEYFGREYIWSILIRSSE